ncbi:MAG: hypothetical protein M3Z24_02250 [Chloroflexota bacterium]|nr:hypothetical protein [Chloroflexota bacterium]
MNETQETQHPLPDILPNASPSHWHKIRLSRWAAAAGAMAIGLLYLALPGHLTFGPNWLLLAIESPLVLLLLLLSLTHHPLPHITMRVLSLILLGIVTVGLAISIALLIITLPTDKHASTLLRSAGVLWCSNILVFALWYWEVDGGGPLKRHLAGHLAADFMFPQQADGDVGNWAPHFLDYLFVAFTGATALSPADTFPLTRTAKGLMMLEAILSMIIIVLLAARAVNMLGS